MATGNVKWFSRTMGAGFIRTEEGQDVFFHVSALRSGNPEVIQRGQRVSFEIMAKPNGLSPSATNMETLECA